MYYELQQVSGTLVGCYVPPGQPGILQGRLPYTQNPGRRALVRPHAQVPRGWPPAQWCLCERLLRTASKKHSVAHGASTVVGSVWCLMCSPGALRPICLPGSGRHWWAMPLSFQDTATQDPHRTSINGQRDISRLSFTLSARSYVTVKRSFHEVRMSPQFPPEPALTIVLLIEDYVGLAFAVHFLQALPMQAMH